MPRPVRVAHVISGDLWAGSEVAVCALLCALARRGDVAVEACLLNDGELAERLAAARVPVRIFPERELGFVRLARRLRSALRDADLVHAHDYKECLLAALCGRPWLATQHGRPEPFAGLAGARMAVYRTLEGLVLSHSARHVVGVSSEVADWLASRFGATRVTRVWSGIDDPPEAAAAAPWRERPRRVGALARLVPVKGLALAVEAAARVPGLELEIVGDGPERDALARRIATSGAAGRIRLRGFDPRPLARLGSWRALLLTSHHEGHPMCAVEGLAMGTPILAGELPGVREIVGAAAGIHVSGRDPGRWARALASFVDDEGAGTRRSRAARSRFLETLTADRCAEKTAALYRTILEAPAR
jgi:glycosyltransferase involved in cell wall biosynthesis